MNILLNVIKRKQKLIIYAVFVIFIILFSIINISNYINQRNEYKEIQKQKFESALTTTINNYTIITNMLYDLYLNEDKVAIILQLANQTNELKPYHEKLGNRLKDFYEVIKNYNIRQLHFHLKDNRSFFRFHRHEKYGDDLTDIRESVRLCNETKQVQIGFEEGRIYNGFRFVYPLFYQNEHVGSVEISFSFNFINESLFSYLKHPTDFLISKSQVEKFVFNDELSNYSECLLNNNFMHDLNINFNNTKTVFKENIYFEIFSKNEIVEINHKMNNGEFFAKEGEFRGSPKIFVFMPIKNFKDENAAYLITYFDDETKNELFLSKITSSVFVISFIVLVGIIINIRERKIKLEKEINTQLQKSNDQKDRLFSVISHDLRSPFTALLGYVDIIIEEFDTLSKDEMKEMLLSLRNSSTNTFSLLEKILNWTRVQLDKVYVEKKHTNIDLLLINVIEKLNDMIGRKNIKIKFNSDSIETEIDKSSYEIVARNILTNAVKFSYPNSEINIDLYKEHEKIILSIRDYGTGIKPELLNRLMNNQLHESNYGTDGEKGTGIGFELIYEYAKYNNGKIEIVSKVNEGTTVNFII
jgi:signal transduction histidine kinase